MNYRLKDSAGTRRGRSSKWLVLGAATVVLVLLRVFAPAFSTTMLHAVFAPFMRSELAVSDAASVSEGLIKSKRQLIDENAELRSELAEAQNKSALAGNLEAENAELRKLLELKAGRMMTAAIVLSKPPLSPYDSLVIEFGLEGNVALGDRVYADGDILLGEIAGVQGSTATVKLYSTAGSEIEATIERNNIAQKTVGSGGGNLEIKAPKEVDVVIGDVLVIPGLEKKILGVVRQIDTQPTDSFQRVFIKSPVNIFQLKWVTIEAEVKS